MNQNYKSADRLQSSSGSAAGVDPCWEDSQLLLDQQHDAPPPTPPHRGPPSSAAMINVFRSCDR